MKYRVLIVDDSVVMRRIVRQSLESDPEIEVAGVAANGKIALAMVAQHTLDAITLDIEMPEMDGLQTLRELRARGIRTPVIMFSTLTERGALATLDALAAGADDYVAKPANVGSVQDSMARIQPRSRPQNQSALLENQGIPLAGRASTAAAVRRRLSARRIGLHSGPPSPSASAPRRSQRIDIVAIGTSTGGPNALAEVIPHIPADFPVPIVIVQHMPPTFTRFLAERLTAASPLLVREGISGSRARARPAPGSRPATST